MSEFTSLEVVEVWQGDNYQAIIRALTSKNTEIKIHVNRKRLVLHDPTCDYHCCALIGEPVKIPKRETPIIEEDPPLEPEPEPEPKTQLPSSAAEILTEDQRRMFKEWGLLKE